VVTWGASPAPPASEREMAAAKLEFSHQTVREIVHTSIGGKTIRVRLSNAYGRASAEISAASIALRASGAAIVQGSDRTLTFGGQGSVVIPPDAEVASDPVQLDIAPGVDLAISLYLPARINGAGIHWNAQQTSYIAPTNVTANAAVESPDTFRSWVFLAGVDVLSPRSVFAIAAFGDSITDGAASTIDGNARWPDVLAARLIVGHKEISVLNAGIGGNRLLHDWGSLPRFGMNGLARFERHVLGAPGVRFVIVLEGINDLGQPGSGSAPENEAVSAEDVIAGYKQLIVKAHDRGIQIIGATLTPFDATTIRGYFSPEKESKRKAINQWIRSGGGFDGVIDFEKAVRDPANLDRMLAAFDSGDHLHPKTAGYKAMGDAIDLSLFERP
jgi:lysophospholipase L1-like esterase